SHTIFLYIHIICTFLSPNTHMFVSAAHPLWRKAPPHTLPSCKKSDGNVAGTHLRSTLRTVHIVFLRSLHSLNKTVFSSPSCPPAINRPSCQPAINRLLSWFFGQSAHHRTDTRSVTVSPSPDQFSSRSLSSLRHW